MDQDFLPALEVGAGDDATHAFLWLHGLGDSGHGHEDVVRMLDLPEGVRPRFVLPHAPSRPVTVNMGMVMPAWYDIREMGGGDHDTGGLRESADQVRKLVDREIARGVPSERVFLCGFSQGGAVALHLGLRYPETLGGVLGLSTYLVDDGTLAEERSEANALLPFFLGHGTEDPMVPVAALAHTRAAMDELGHAVTVKTYPMEHAICPEEIQDISEWISGLTT